MSSVTSNNIHKKPFSAKTSKKKRRSRRSGKLKKQDKIQRIALNYGNKGICISFKQIAKRVGCTETYAKITIAKLVKAGKVIKTSTEFVSKKYDKERVLCGKNIYTSPKKSTPKSTEKDTSKINPKTNYLNLYKYKFANGTTHRNFSKEKSSQDGFRKHKVEVLGAYGFQDHAQKAPLWWFRDLARLKKALKLLKRKQAGGYKCKNFIYFISFLLKHGTFGYRRHCARNLSLAINKPTLERIEPLMASSAIAQGYEALKELHKKHNLDVSFTNMTKLLRKNYPQLSMAAQVMVKRLKIPGVEDTNKYLHFLVSMSNPLEVLQRKAT